jgi:transcriptional regulator with XRE-family HTH domain
MEKCNMNRQRPPTPFGKLIAEWSATKKMSQAELARRIGIDPSYVNQISSGKKAPTNLSLLMRIAYALELDSNQIDQLFKAAQISQRSIRLPEDLPTEAYEMAADFIQGLAGLNQSQLACMRQVVDAVRNLASDPPF